MIVLGPHVLSHHLLEDDRDCEGDNENCNAITTTCAESCHFNGSHTAEQKQKESDSTSNTFSPLYVPQGSIQIDGELTCRWREARLRISAVLGSIGAPPLALGSSIEDQQSTLPIICNNNNDIIRDNVAESNNMKDTHYLTSLQTNLDCISDMATAHAELLQTMNRILETVSVGTSVQLGLGPINAAGNIGNGRLVARAEKAWVARQLLQQSRGSESNNEAQCNNSMNTPKNVVGNHPRLTLHKIRNILHQAIVDQAISLQGVLDAMKNVQCTASTKTEWDEVTSDLELSLQVRHTLTLSQLSIWVNRLGGFLSFVLQNFLAQKNLRVLVVPKNHLDSLIAGVTHSLQIARERRVFLQSACPCSQQPHEDENNLNDGHGNNDGKAESNIIDDHVAQAKRQEQRKAEMMIQNLQATLEAARISLWAFGQSYSDQTDHGIGSGADDSSHQTANGPILQDADSAKVWWSQFKDLMERSCASVPDFEDQFLSTTACNNAEQDSSENDGIHDLPNANDCIAEYSEHVSNVSGIKDENILSNSGEESKYPSVGKTLVFSGSGIKTPQPLHKQAMPVSSEQGGLSTPRVFNAADQMMLLRDLEKRITTMGLAEEHEVIDMKIVDNVDGDKALGTAQINRVTPSSSNNSNNRREGSQPFFLGVSGSLLTELSSALQIGTVTFGEGEADT